MDNIISLFKTVKVDPSWSFSEVTRKETSYITHGYHRYPAKFIPQVVSRLVAKFSTKKDLRFNNIIAENFKRFFMIKLSNATI